MLQSTEGSTDSYRQVGDKIWPVYAHYEYEEEQKLVCCIKEWQQGALDYIEQKKNYLKEDEDYVKFAQPLIAIGKNPTLKMVKLFSFFYNTDGEKEYYVSQKKLVQYKPRELMHALSNSVWKTGFLKSSVQDTVSLFLYLQDI